MVMAISNYAGSADTFTWPHNPNVFDDAIDSNYEFTNIPFSRYHFLVSGGGIPPKQIVLTGHFDGANKFTNYRGLAVHFTENHKLKKLYWESDKFYLGIGKSIKQTNSGGRTNFIDYVSTFETVIGILFGNTQKTSGTNDGNVTTFIEEITGTVTSGASNITVTDGTNSYLIPATSLTTGQAIVIKFVHMVDSGNGIYVTEFRYCTVAGTQIKTVQTSAGSGIIQLGAGLNVSTITVANLTNAVVKFRDGWVA